MPPHKRPRKRETLLRLSDRGVTVRVFRRKGFAPLQLEVEERQDGRLVRQERRSFRDADEATAKQAAAQVFANLVGTAPTGQRSGALTLAEVVHKYLASAAFRNTKERTMQERKATLGFLLGYAHWAALPAHEFGQEQALDYFQARTKGAYRRHPRVETVSKREAQAELQVLRTVLNWAYSTREQGARLVKERVFDGLVIPGAGAATQPALNEGVFHALWAVRHRVHPAFGAALALAETYGKRGNSIRQLEWLHVNWLEHTVFWSPEYDKQEQIGLFWLPPDVETVLKAWHRHPKRPDSRWVFPAPHNADMPIDRRGFFRWLAQAYHHAGLVKPGQGGWHSFRRWFTTRNATAQKAAMNVAGMRNASTFLRYQQPPEDELRAVLMNRPLLRGE